MRAIIDGRKDGAATEPAARDALPQRHHPSCSFGRLAADCVTVPCFTSRDLRPRVAQLSTVSRASGHRRALPLPLPLASCAAAEEGAAYFTLTGRFVCHFFTKNRCILGEFG